MARPSPPLATTRTNRSRSPGPACCLWRAWACVGDDSNDQTGPSCSDGFRARSWHKSWPEASLAVPSTTGTARAPGHCRLVHRAPPSERLSRSKHEVFGCRQWRWSRAAGRVPGGRVSGGRGGGGGVGRRLGRVPQQPNHGSCPVLSWLLGGEMDGFEKPTRGTCHTSKPPIWPAES